ncbi:MAG: hypothetical protein R3F30_01880 [Planctomycetota bacterium]
MDAHDDHERPEAEPSAEDLRLRELLAAHEVPGPSADFVADTLLRLQLDQWSTPDPSPGFVDRVVTAWADERGSGPAGAVREPVPAARPVPGPSRSAGARPWRCSSPARPAPPPSCSPSSLAAPASPPR